MKLALIALTFFLALSNALSAPNLLKHKEKSKSNIIKLTKNNYERILEGPRDSHILLLLTATNPQIGCSICQQLSPEYEKLANSWFLDHPDGDNLFFAKSDFADGYREIFQSFQLTNVPRLYLYSPSGEHTPITEGFEQLPIPTANLALELAQSLQEATQKKIRLHEPVAYGNIIITALFSFCTVFLLKKNFSSIRALLTNRPLWGALIVFSILLFNTGYMFNAIRGVPYARPTQDGGVEYFIPGQQQQLGAETQVLSFVYGILAFCAVLLATKVKSIGNEKVQFMVIAIITLVIILAYSSLISIFRFKSPGYPYRLLELWS